MIDATTTLPAHWYTDDAIYQAERRQIFGKSWLYAAHESELAKPGDYITREIAGYPIYLVRQPDTSIKAYFNICRHRAAPLLTAPRGHLDSRTITCRYHGWSYSTENGHLAAAPYFENLNAEDRCKMGLNEVRVATFQGLIFTNLSRVAQPLDKTLGQFLAVIENSSHDLHKYDYHSQVVREGSFNWKIWLDGYQECYHCTTIHPVFLRDFALHKYKVENHELFSSHSCDRKVESSSGDSDGLWLWAYPNLGMPVYEPCFYTLQVNPLHVDKTRLTYTFHFKAGSSDKLIADFLQFVDQVTDEDISICEAVQKNLASGGYGTGFLHQSRENGVAYFQSLVREAVERELTGEQRDDGLSPSPCSTAVC